MAMAIGSTAQTLANRGFCENHSNMIVTQNPLPTTIEL